MKQLNWALYIGQKIKTDSTLCMSGVDVLTGITYSEKGSAILHCKDGAYDTSLCDCKPILRDFNQMTEDETEEFWLKRNQTDDSSARIKSDDWLTSKGFAIRGEIENGLAIKEE